ncbi:MAG: HAD family hydrolase [Prevotella sp.]|nr:HAD family hydrolase [Prevotella sp.]MEE1092875.1 HAD family hydrolase [Prevotella sp.]
MRIKAVILDFDGTMGDTQDLIVRTMQQTIQQLGLPSRTDEQCAAMIGLPLKHTFTTLIEMSEEMGERCAELYRRLFNENNVPGAVPVFPNVLDTVRTLHERGLILTIASARRRDTLVEFLESMNLMQYIPYVISASDIENAKPAPDMVLKTLEDYHLSADEAIVVGDTKYDIEMAHRAGVKAVGVTYGNGTVEELRAYGAEYIIDDFAQLLDIVQ